MKSSDEFYVLRWRVPPPYGWRYEYYRAGSRAVSSPQEATHVTGMLSKETFDRNGYWDTKFDGYKGWELIRYSTAVEEHRIAQVIEKIK